MPAVKIESELYEALREHCLERSIPVRHFVARAVKRELEERGKRRAPVRKFVCVRIPERETDALSRPPFWARGK
jgi:hypothetical protein